MIHTECAGYLSYEHRVRIPPGLKTMDIFINYDHFVIDLPAPKTLGIGAPLIESTSGRGGGEV